MNVKNWILLLLVYVLYLCLGGAIFKALECPHYQESRNNEISREIRLSSALEDFQRTLTLNQTNQFNDIFKYIKISETEGEGSESCGKWDFFNSLFFSFTAVTTIGYGHQAPETNDGRLACVFYSLVGVPLNAILIGALGALFSNKVSGMKRRLQAAGNRGLHGMGKIGRIVLEGLFWLLTFTSLFLFLPAAFFAYSGLESKNWDYVDSVYYTFITLSTIGFGDLVAGRNEDSDMNDSWRIVYQVSIIIWIIFGLGYIIGVLNVLAEAMQSTSKPVKRVFRALKNQHYGQDYWKKILHEIISIKKESGEEDWMKGSLMTGVGGGSEPCLGDTSLTEDITRKRSVSTGDIQILPEDKGDGSQLNPEFQSSLHSLDKNCLSDIQELNEDTITSLRHFLQTSNMVGGLKSATTARDKTRDLGEWMSNNFPDDPGLSLPSLPPTRPASRAGSFKFHGHTVHDVPRRNRFSSLHSQRGRLNRRHSLTSNRSVRSTASQGSIIGQLLERTTLGEFLTAVENVKVKTEAETMMTTESENAAPPVRKKSSVFRKISQISRQSSRLQVNQGPLTLGQVTNLLAQASERPKDSEMDKSTNPLVRSHSSSTLRTISMNTGPRSAVSTPEIQVRVIAATPSGDAPRNPAEADTRIHM